jgi:DUF1680 family protein
MITMRTQLGGLLGSALEANRTGRLSHFITDEASPAIALFSPERVAHNHEGDWYGEHAGKWLYAAAKAARRVGDATVLANVRRVADYLVRAQGEDGYLGTYASARRFMQRQPRGPKTWDGAPGQRTWDIWTHSYLILGMLEVHRLLPDGPYLDCARRIADLCWRTLAQDGLDITELGNHFGLSATVLLDPVVSLHFATGEQRYLDLAQLILAQANHREGLELLPRALAGADAADIATGKSYQICWQLVGLTRLYRAIRDSDLLAAVNSLWNSIHAHHLTLGGGPWGGVGLRSREIFNPPQVFSPRGYVETCATFSWMQLNRELLELTGEVKYAEEIERSAYNDLLGAQAPNGEDWCYYSFPNGPRVFTTYWRCCKSSGAMALEDLPDAVCTVSGRSDIAVNLYSPGVTALQSSAAGNVQLEQLTRYPLDGDVRIRVEPQRPARFAIRLRIPTWASGATIAVNGVEAGTRDRAGATVTPGTFALLDREWRAGDEITLHFPMAPVLHVRSSSSVQESRLPDGTPLKQEVMRQDHVAVTRGPLVYASGLIDGFRVAETVRMGAQPQLEVVDAPAGFAGPAIRMSVEQRDPLVLLPYYEAGERVDGGWRITWLQMAPIG